MVHCNKRNDEFMERNNLDISPSSGDGDVLWWCSVFTRRSSVKSVTAVVVVCDAELVHM